MRVLALAAATLAVACAPVALAAPAVAQPSSSQQPSRSSLLEATSLQLSVSQITLPELDAAATLTVRNSSSALAVVLKPSLGFFVESPSGTLRDATQQVYVESNAKNPWFIQPGQSADFKFKIQFLHDAPVGTLRVLPRLEYFSQADNAFPELTNYALSNKQWQVENPAKGFNAKAIPVKGELAPAGAGQAVQLSVEDNRLKGRITLQSPLGTLQPNTDYVAGVLLKSDRSGWDSPINKGAAVTEYDEKGAVRAHPLHLFEVPYWNWELLRFKSTSQSAKARMDVWNRGWKLKQKGASWYGAAFLVLQKKVHVLKSVATAPTVNATATAAPNIAFLGDDRPQAGEGGNWIGRYGNESFILCGMQAPQDIVGGRLLPKRRWSKGKNGFAVTVPVWTDWRGEFFYEVLTGDPKEPPRHWIPIDDLTTSDPRALVNPLEGGRRYSSWDDRGEERPFDDKGPDLVVNLEIPQGLHRLSLYFIDWDFYNTSRPRTHRLLISDGSKDEKALLSSGYVSNFGQGIYKVYGVSGPSKLRLRIQKDKSVCAVLSGIFLDEVNLSDSKLVLPAQDKQNASLRQAVQIYNELRLLQSEPEKFLAAGEQMKRVLRLANLTLNNASKEEKLAAEWLRWQATSSLVVAPWVKEPAFFNYITARSPANIVAARLRVEWLLDQGEVGLARQATQVWLNIAGMGKSGLKSRHQALILFSKRDTNYACLLAQNLVRDFKMQGVEMQVTLQAANALMRLAESGSNDTDAVYRVVVALLEAVKSIYGKKALGSEAAFHLAEAKALSPGYRFAAPRRAVTAYKQYIEEWPQGKHVGLAYSRLIRLADTYAVPGQFNARFFADTGANAVRSLFVSIRANHLDSLQLEELGYGANGSEIALRTTQKIATIFTRLNDKAVAKQWQQEGQKQAIKLNTIFVVKNELPSGEHQISQ